MNCIDIELTTFKKNYCKNEFSINQKFQTWARKKYWKKGHDILLIVVKALL